MHPVFGLGGAGNAFACPGAYRELSVAPGLWALWGRERRYNNRIQHPRYSPMAGSAPSINPNKIPSLCGPCPRCGKTEVVHMAAKTVTEWVCAIDVAHVFPSAPKDGFCPACAAAGAAAPVSARSATRAAVCFCMACNRAFPKPLA